MSHAKSLRAAEIQFILLRFLRLTYLMKLKGLGSTLPLVEKRKQNLVLNFIHTEASQKPDTGK